MSTSYWFTSPKTLTLGLTWPPRGIHFWSLCHQFRSLSSFLVTTSDFFFMFPPPPRNERYLAAARVARRGGFAFGFRRAGRPGPASRQNFTAIRLERGAWGGRSGPPRARRLGSTKKVCFFEFFLFLFSFFPEKKEIPGTALRSSFKVIAVAIAIAIVKL